jgi:hypothetical protein
MSIVRRNACIILPLAAVQTTAYWLINHFPIRPSSTLPLTAIDEAIPFLRWTVWPYLLLMVAGPILVLFIESWAVMRRVLIAYAFSAPPAFLVLLLFPTHSQRPAVESDLSLTGRVYSWLIEIDTPLCAFPSGHILVPTLAVWGVWIDRWRTRWLVLIGFGLLAPTILTTKQHYFWDLLGGLGFALIGILVSTVTVYNRSSSSV